MNLAPPPGSPPVPPSTVPLSTQMRGDGRGTMDRTAPVDGGTRAPPGLAAWVQGGVRRIYMAVGFYSKPNDEPVLVEASLPATKEASAAESPSAELLDFMGFLGSVFRDVYMHNESRQIRATVTNITDFIDRAVADEGAMSRFIHALGCADKEAAKDSSHWRQTQRATKRSTCGAYLALEVLRKGVNQEKRHALQNWMAQMLEVRFHCCIVPFLLFLPPPPSTPPTHPVPR